MSRYHSSFMVQAILAQGVLHPEILKRAWAIRADVERVIVRGSPLVSPSVIRQINWFGDIVTKVGIAA